MQDIIPQTTTQPVPARRILCGLCWAPIGKPCTVGGLPGDHLVRYVESVKAGLLSKGELAAAIASLTVIADHVMIMERVA